MNLNYQHFIHRLSIFGEELTEYKLGINRFLWNVKLVNCHPLWPRLSGPFRVGVVTHICVVEEFLGKKNWQLSYFKNWKFCAYFFGVGGRQRGKLEHGNAGQSRIQGPCENIHNIDIQAHCNNIDVDYTLTASHSLIWVSLNCL